MKLWGHSMVGLLALACGGGQPAPGAKTPACAVSVVVTPDGTDWIGDITVAKRPEWPEAESGQDVVLKVNDKALPIVQIDEHGLGGRLRNAPKQPGEVSVCIGFSGRAVQCETMKLTESCIRTAYRGNEASFGSEEELY